MKLLDTKGGNVKLQKANRDLTVRIAGLSMMPDDKVCPMRQIAQCAAPCLKSSGRGTFDSVTNARLKKTEWYHTDRKGFISQLKKEIVSFVKSCKRQGVEPYIRLNVISDIQWELTTNGSIPQAFPDVQFLDYTKISKRLKTTPKNYNLIFSWSNAPGYQGEVKKALQTDRPVSVVFHGPMPKSFLNRDVIDGDQSDIENVSKMNKIIGLKYKTAKGQGVDPLHSTFIVNTMSE